MAKPSLSEQGLTLGSSSSSPQHPDVITGGSKKPSAQQSPSVDPSATRFLNRLSRDQLEQLRTFGKDQAPVMDNSEAVRECIDAAFDTVQKDRQPTYEPMIPGPITAVIRKSDAPDWQDLVTKWGVEISKRVFNANRDRESNNKQISFDRTEFERRLRSLNPLPIHRL